MNQTQKFSRAMKKSRLERPKKTYHSTQCALFGIRGLGQLRKVLLWNASQRRLERIAYKPSSYRVWVQDGRNIQAAVGELRQLHFRIATLLRRIKPPSYRHSGVRGRSYISNGAAHAVGEPMLKLDVSAYYPSTTFAHTYSFFRDSLQCSEDVAVVLTRICCYQDRHLPTGGVHSEVVAFYTHKPLFDQLAERARARCGIFTVYVDDLALSFAGASKSDLKWAANIIQRHDLRLNTRKSRVIRKRHEKVITGVKILGRQVLAPNRNHLKLVGRFRDLSYATENEKETAARRLLGQLDQIAQIEPGFRERAFGNRTRLKHLLLERS